MYEVWTFENYWFLQVLTYIWKKVMGTFLEMLDFAQ